jgi:hypothetical protein
LTTTRPTTTASAGSPHYKVAVEQADGDCELENNANQGDAGDPYPGSGGTHNPNARLNAISTPNSNSYADAASGVSIYNIHYGGDGVAYVSVAVGLVPPTVQFAAPNGGEILTVGAEDTVRWVAFDDIEVDSVSILLSTDGGATFPTVLAHGEPNDSSFVWTVTGPASQHCRIRVVAYDRSGYTAYDGSDADFTIYDVAGVATGGPIRFGIVSVNPNPSASGAEVLFTSPHHSGQATVYDVAGRLVKNLSVGVADPGAATFSAAWDGRNERGAQMAAGVYFVRVASGDEVRTARLTIVK